MDSRIYFHEYRRPRHHNPSYLSTNVANSMTAFFHFDPFAPTTHPTLEPTAGRSQSVSPGGEGGSRLSGVGSRLFDQRTVHHKQTQQFDIVSNKPLQFDRSIKQYPPYSLENREDNYYRLHRGDIGPRQ